MPLIPTGLTQGLIDRLQNRVDQELGVQEHFGPAPEEVQPTAPIQPEQEAPRGLFRRIRDRVQQYFDRQEAPEAPRPHTGPPRGLPEVMDRIQAAGRQRPPVLLRMLYNGSWRDVEPYSYRYRAAEEPHIPLFYGFCGFHQWIHSFKLQRIQDLQVTEQPFQPRWPVEF